MGVIVVILFHTMPASMYQKMVVKKTQLKNKACDVTFLMLWLCSNVSSIKGQKSLFVSCCCCCWHFFLFNLTSWQKWHEVEDQKENKPTPFPLFDANTLQHLFLYICLISFDYLIYCPSYISFPYIYSKQPFLEDNSLKLQ